MSDIIRYSPDTEWGSAVPNPTIRSLRSDGSGADLTLVKEERVTRHTVVVRRMIEGFVEMSREQYDIDGGKADSSFTFELQHGGKTYRFVGIQPEIEADRVTFRFRCPA
jgi:hypothetical protein